MRKKHIIRYINTPTGTNTCTCIVCELWAATKAKTVPVERNVFFILSDCYCLAADDRENWAICGHEQKKHCGMLTLPWRWRSQAGSTCHQGNSWGQKFPGPPSWWPFPQQRKQRYSHPIPEKNKHTDRINVWQQKQQEEIDFLSTQKGQVLVKFPHQYGVPF